jgi:hypothetical protein
MKHDDKGDKFKVEKTLDSVSAKDFDGCSCLVARRRSKRISPAREEDGSIAKLSSTARQSRNQPQTRRHPGIR